MPIEVSDKISFHERYFVRNEYANGLQHESWNNCECSLSNIIRKNMNDLIQPAQGTNNKSESQSQGIEPVQFPALDRALEIMSAEFPQFLFTDLNKAKEWFIGLYAGLAPKVPELIKHDENGKIDSSQLSQRIAYVECIIKSFKTYHSSLELMKISILKDASLEEKARIYEEDKKYKPLFKDESPKAEKLTETEKQIRKLMKLFSAAGQTEDQSRISAEKIIFGEKK